MADAKARLNSLFQGGGGGGGAAQGNDALRYVAPREPTRAPAVATQQPAPSASAASSSGAAAAAVVYSTTVSLYQYDTGARKYQQMGTAASTVVGCVLVGSETTYAVLFYNADKAPLCELPVLSWKPTVQPKHYLNFYDDQGHNWSAKFANDEALTELMRQVFLARIHIEIWRPQRTLDANALVKQDLGAAAIKDNGEAPATMGPGDTVGVEFKCWRVVGNAKCAPNEVVTKYPPFERTADGELRKFRIGDGAERIRALDEGVVGMKRGARRLILAPPGKTNGQDWYLLDVTLVKTKSGGGGSSRKDAAEAPSRRASGSSVSAATPNASERKSRRKTTPAPAVNGDLVPYDEDAMIPGSKEELELKELRLLQRERQLELEQRALESARLNLGGGGGVGASSNPLQQPQAQVPQQQQQQQQPTMSFSNPYASAFNPYGSMFAPPAAMQTALTTTGRPVDGMLMELNAKIDYLIRMTPASGNNTGAGYGGGLGAGLPVGATDVQAVLRGVERLAGENERLLLQINSQNQQYVSYEKRCEELLKHNQRLQDEKRLSEEKYQSLASQQLNVNAEITALTSARDAAITQTNRLHAEYQQLLTAFYQKQQVSSESEEQRNELNFERQARMRLEKELSKETQTRSLVEQELTLIKKQLDVFSKMKESETQTHRQELEAQVQATRASEQQTFEDRLRKLTQEYQQQEARLQEEWQRQLDRQTKQLNAQLANLETQVADATREKDNLATDLALARAHVQELEVVVAEKDAAISLATEPTPAMCLGEEEQRIYQEQIELLQQQVKELEAEKFARVQQDLDAGRLSPTASPRSRKKLTIVDDAQAGYASGPCSHCAAKDEALSAALARADAADRTLAMAEEVKREAEAMLTRSNSRPSSSSSSSETRDKLVGLFKDSINEMFFRFQDVFEDEAATGLEGKQVLGVIRKVLKQSTKDVIQRLQEDTGGDDEPMAAPTPRASVVSTMATPRASVSSGIPAVPLASTIAAAQETAYESSEEPSHSRASVTSSTTTAPRASAFTAFPSVPLASAVAAAQEAAYESSDEPPPPPEPSDDESTVPTAGAGASLEPEEATAPTTTTTERDETDKDEDAGNETTDDDGDLLFGAASAGSATANKPSVATTTSTAATGLPRRIESDVDESEDDFDD